MNCDDLREYYELYAIGVAEEPERSEIRAHLNRECEVCMQGLRGAREIAALLEGSAEPVAPSAKLRRRILASAGYQDRSFGWAPALAGALAFSLVACVYFVGRERDVVKEVARLTAIGRQQDIQLTRLTEMFGIINGSDTTVSTFGQGDAQPPRGKVFVNPSQGVLLVAGNLPPAPAGKAYEMWVIPKGGKPAPAGLFQSSAEGAAVHFQRGKVDPNAALVAVTLEDAAGADQPTSPVLFAAQVHVSTP